jgi:hypothetical protein
MWRLLRRWWQTPFGALTPAAAKYFMGAIDLADRDGGFSVWPWIDEPTPMRSAKCEMRNGGRNGHERIDKN